VGRSEVTNREVENLASVVAEILERGVSPSSIISPSPFKERGTKGVRSPYMARERGQGDRVPK